MGSLSWWHWLLIIAAFVLLFGAKKLPEAARGVGRSLRILKSEVNAMHEDDAGRKPAETDASAARATPTAQITAGAPVTAQPVQPAPLPAVQPVQQAPVAVAQPVQQPTVQQPVQPAAQQPVQQSAAQPAQTVAQQPVVQQPVVQHAVVHPDAVPVPQDDADPSRPAGS